MGDRYLSVFIKCLQGWFDTSFQVGAKHHRTVNQILGNLLCLHWPGLVTHLGTSEQVSCLSWDMYRYQIDSRYQHAQGAAWNAFWVSFAYHVNYHLFQLLVDDFYLKFGFAWSL
jgi:hypothetical protein